MSSENFIKRIKIKWCVCRQARSSWDGNGWWWFFKKKGKNHFVCRQINQELNEFFFDSMGTNQFFKQYIFQIEERHVKMQVQNTYRNNISTNKQQTRYVCMCVSDFKLGWTQNRWLVFFIFHLENWSPIFIYLLREQKSL